MSQHAPMRVATPDGVSFRSANGAILPGRRSCSFPVWHKACCRSGGSSKASWRAPVSASSPTILRGHGLSDKPTDPACYQDGKRWADEVHAVIAAKRLRRPVLVGWSLGGRMLRQYLMHYGDVRLGGINFLAAGRSRTRASSGRRSKAMQEDTSRDLAGRIAH